MIEVPAKWVLTGEHAVLKGASAIALPHPEYSLKLKYEPGEGLYVNWPEGDPKPVPELILKTCHLTKQKIPQGTLTIESNIPHGAGLGSSAALCVAITKLFTDRNVFETATELEDFFHGKSSGMDVAVVYAEAPIVFKMGGKPDILKVDLPKFTFHDTGLRSLTKECVAKVNRLREENKSFR